MRTRLILLSVFAIFFLGNCAKEMLPTGGKKDMLPPKVLKTRPKNYSTNISPTKIIITFDEFVELKNAQQRIIISPPLNKPLKIHTRGKSVIVEIKDILKPNTTYNINFNDVLRDFNEGNILENFQYVFSTGNHIDSLYISGRVFDAMTGKPVENIQVGIYSDFSDSVVLKQKPDYYSKTDKKGFYSINNIPGAGFKIFALADIDNNMRYNLPNESIGFLSDTISPMLIRKTTIDTIRVIAQINPKTDDTLWKDSILINEKIISTCEEINLRLFTATFDKQFVKKTIRPRKNQVALVFNRPTARNVALINAENKPFLLSNGSTSDSLVFFVPDKQSTQSDSLLAILSYEDYDSVNIQKRFSDTLTFVLEPNQQVKEDTILVVNHNIENKTLELGQDFILHFSQPLSQFDSKKSTLFVYEDSISIKIPHVFVFDSIKQSAIVNAKINPDQEYSFAIDSSAFIDIYGNTNLPQKIDFKTPAEIVYGVLVVIPLFDLPEGTVFQLTDKDGKKVIRQNRPTSSQNITFNYLKPGTYNLRMFRDQNNNDKQDPGNYFKGIQPEYSVRYEKEITIRANWDTEITWKLQTK
ncbi:MAG TPA: Ig-like domain-containing protein [Salinivirgaceae bacterium]|nr:Ig-like domain-containing protein [Salinivirgaceae bacterium]